MRIEKTNRTGFCFGVKRALGMLEKLAQEQGPVETLGAVVHNQQVLNKLARIGVTVAESIDEIRGKTIVVSAHGISPKVEKELCARNIEIIDTTCPFVRRAQSAARKLNEAGFFVVVYGDANHPEVKGILGWADDHGVATFHEKAAADLKPLPQKLGILSQTTQIPADFIEFAKKATGAAFTKGSEIRIIDTICHDIRERQKEALEVAERSEVMLVIGSRTSANTKHLTELCATVTETHLVENAEDLQARWFEGQPRVGITTGASTSDETIDEVLAKLEEITGPR